MSACLTDINNHGNLHYCFYPQAKQRSPYALNTAGDGLEDQDGDSRYCLFLYGEDLHEPLSPPYYVGSYFILSKKKKNILYFSKGIEES